MGYSLKSKIYNALKNIFFNNSLVDKEAAIGKNVKLLGCKIAKNSFVGKNSAVLTTDVSGQVTIGEDNFFEDVVIRGSFISGENCRIRSCMISGTVSIGDYTSLWGPNLDIITGSQKVTIGNFCSIARNVSIQTFDHNAKKLTTYFIGQNLFKEKWENERSSKGNVVIENDVWIGTHSVILGGVTIHNGAIVAANSVVTKDVPAFSIVAGSPAKVIGYRFDSEVIDAILKEEWWYWPIEKIKKNKAIFEKGSVDLTIIKSE